MRLKKILITDPRPFSREGLKSVLGLRDCSIVFFDAGNEHEFVRAVQHCKAFDLILVHADFLSVGNNGLITSYLYKNDNPIVVICNEITPDLDVKLNFFEISGVIRNTESIPEIEKKVFSILSRRGEPNLFSQQVCREIRDPYTDKFSAKKASDTGYSFIKDKLGYLTDRQNVVLNYLKVGLMNKEIAFEMGIQESTVKRHVSDIFKKLQVKNRTQLAVSLSD